MLQAPGKWTVRNPKGDFRAMGERWGVSPVTAHVMAGRGITDDRAAEEFLSGGAAPASEDLLNGMWKLTWALEKEILAKKRIRVIGDYDIDGVMATYILVKGLERCGADAGWALPDRVRDGYGLNPRLVEEAAADGAGAIITCDNGIAAAPAISLAKAKGMTVLVTDHHEPPFHMEGGRRMEDLPPADAIVDPHRAGCIYPYRDICGASVAWKAVRSLYRKMGIPPEEADAFMPYAAFATIGDVMPLTGENRRLVKEGLRALACTGSPGLQALISGCGLAGKELTAYHVGYVLGPCINAAGRLGSAGMAMELLMAGEWGEAERAAERLIGLNADRKAMTDRAVREACAAAEGMAGDRVLAIFLEDCHESIAGIVAGKVRERFSRPAFVLTKGSEGGRPCLKGSGRSVEGWDMHAALQRIGEAMGPSMLKAGGHAMAAGLSIAEGALGQFREEACRACSLTMEDMAPKVRLDMALPFRYAALGLADELSRLEPFGTGNEKPLFGARGVRFTGLKVLGASGNALRGTAEDGEGTRAEAIWFGPAEEMKAYIESRPSVAVAYTPERNEFRGEARLQLNIRHVL